MACKAINDIYAFFFFCNVFRGLPILTVTTNRCVASDVPSAGVGWLVVLLMHSMRALLLHGQF